MGLDMGMKTFIDDKGDMHCLHPEVRLGKLLNNPELDPSKMYCLACGEEVYE